MNESAEDIIDILTKDIEIFSEFIDLNKLKYGFTSYSQLLKEEGIEPKSIIDFNHKSSGFFINDQENHIHEELGLPFFTELYANTGKIKLFRTYFMDETSNMLSSARDIFLNDYLETHIFYDIENDYIDGNFRFPRFYVKDGAFYSGVDVIDSLDVSKNPLKEDFIDEPVRYAYDFKTEVKFISQNQLYFLENDYNLQLSHDTLSDVYIILAKNHTFLKSDKSKDDYLEMHLKLPFNKINNIKVLLDSNYVSDAEVFRTLSKWYGDTEVILNSSRKGPQKTSFVDGLSALNMYR